jgi:AbrB family looped-hinge helix DNA binding protein
MFHSRVTSKGQTTIPGKVRKALQIKPGDELEYVVAGSHATIRVHPGTRSYAGALASSLKRRLIARTLRDATGAN